MYRQANNQIHPSEKVKQDTILKMERQQSRSWGFQKPILAFASICLCAGLSVLVMQLQSAQESDLSGENNGLMLADEPSELLEAESGPQAFSLEDDRISAYPDVVLTYQFVMEANNEDGSKTLMYQDETHTIEVMIIDQAESAKYRTNSIESNQVFMDTEEYLITFASDNLSKEELEQFAEYFK